MNDYDANFLGLYASLPSDTVFTGIVVRSVPSLNVTIKAIANNIELLWRSSNDPNDFQSNQISYKVWQSTNPSQGFSHVTTVNDTSWTDLGVLSSNEKRFYQITAGFYE